MREALKTTAFVVATVLVAPALVSFYVRARFLSTDRALDGSMQALSLIPGLLGQYLRRAFLARTLDRCAPSVTVEFGTLFSQAASRLDEHVYVGPRCHLGLVHIERDVLIGAGVHIPSGSKTHGFANLHVPIREQPGAPRMVRVGEGSWIGSACIVMADVGKHCVVAAGAVVTKPIPDYAIAAGVPAKVIGSRSLSNGVEYERRQALEVRS